MTDLETSRRLALAIGWEPRRVDSHQTNAVWVLRTDTCAWHRFDHRDPAIAFRVAERYNKFPYMHRGKDGSLDGKWVVWPGTLEDTPQDAIALAVINGAKE